MKHIYLDHNSTTPIDPRVAEAMHARLLAGYANPASQHDPGRRARRILENTRESVASSLNCRIRDIHADRVIFTSGATEANNLALLGLAGQPPGRILISAIEHPSVVGPAEYLATIGFGVRRIRVDGHGVVDLDHLRELLDADTKLVSIMLGNNETGAIQPVQEAAQICAEYGVPMHTDAVQAVGKIPVDFESLGVTALSLTAHKFHGPGGIGALIVRHDADLRPLLFGGFQQQGLRPGTESAALPVGLQTAIELWQHDAETRQQHLQNLRDRLESGLRDEIPEIVINGVDAPRLPHTSSVAFPGLDRQSLVMALDMAGVACSTGSACASGSSEPSPVLLAMGLPRTIIDGSIRLSVGMTNTPAEIDLAIERISLVANKLRKRKSGENPRASAPQSAGRPI